MAMGLPKTSKVKDAAAIRSVKTGGCYIRDKETGGRLLRPDWKASSAENSPWHQRMLDYTRQQVPLINPLLTADVMDAKSDDEILERLMAVFKNFAGTARAIAKAGAEAC
ncbi:hypothetical protein B0H13DRAFT_2300028 [Mycena leptocephala]|nr:hypothetical protein B0H13DRAFT_2300028 [Mycena leptocephala]